MALVVFGRHVFVLTPVIEIDGLRPFFGQGANGVSFFFILSGFVLTWSRRDDDTAAAFYGRRFARIIPAYVVVLVLALAIRMYDGEGSLAVGVPSFLLLQAWFPNPHTHFALNGVAWSLSVELFFYAVYPLVLFALLKVRRVGARHAVLAACLLWPLAVAVLLNPAQGTDQFWLLYICPLVRLPEFIAGCLLALAVQTTKVRVPFGGAAAVAVGAYVASGFVPEPYMWVGITAIPYAGLIVAAAEAELSGGVAWLRDRRLVWLGAVSYSFYLVHTLVIDRLTRWFADRTALYVLALPLAVVAATALFVAIERPAERALRRNHQRATAV